MIRSKTKPGPDKKKIVEFYPDSEAASSSSLVVLAASKLNISQTRGGGGTPRKIRYGCAARLPKPLPYL